MHSFTEHSEREDSISYTFSKEERLCSKKLIDELFRKGSSFNLYPLRFVLLRLPQPPAACPQVLVSVSKRYFKKAVDRNRLKRRIREAYRLHKHLMQGKTASPHLIAIMYIGKEEKPFKSIEKKLISGLERSLIE